MQVCTLLQTDNHASTPPLSMNIMTSAFKWAEIQIPTLVWWFTLIFLSYLFACDLTFTICDYDTVAFFDYKYCCNTHTLTLTTCKTADTFINLITRGKVLSWEYRSLRKRNSRTLSTNHCRQAVLLLIYYRKTIKGQGRLPEVCLHWKKSPVYGVFGQ